MIPSKYIRRILLLSLVMLQSACVVHVGSDDFDWQSDLDWSWNGDHETGDVTKMNNDVNVGQGQTLGDIDSVNGKVVLRNHSSAKQVKTVNGSVRIYDDVSVYSVGTVNGDIRGGDNLTVDENLSTVNGRIDLQQGTLVLNDIHTVNGTIELRKTEVGRDVSTLNGDIRLLRGSIVSGDVVFEENHSRNSKRTKPRLVVDAGSAIMGTVHLYREVELHLEDGVEPQIVEHF